MILPAEPHRCGPDGVVTRTRHQYLNFAETRRDVSVFWNVQAYERLRRIKREIDPVGLIRSNHPIEP